MEESFTKFIERIFTNDPDYNTLTKGKLRKQYLMENGLPQLNKEEKHVFSSIVNKMLDVYSTKSINAQNNVSDVPKLSCKTLTISVDKSVDNSSSICFSNGAEKAEGKLINVLHEKLEENISDSFSEIDDDKNKKKKETNFKKNIQTETSVSHKETIQSNEEPLSSQQDSNVSLDHGNNSSKEKSEYSKSEKGSKYGKRTKSENLAFCDSSSDDETIVPFKSKMRKSISVSSLTDESNDIPMNKAAITDSHSGTDDEEKLPLSSNGSIKKGKKFSKQKAINFNENIKPRILLRKPSFDGISDIVTVSKVKKLKSSSKEVSDLEGSVSSDDEVLQRKSNIKMRKEPPVKVNSSSKENDSEDSNREEKKKRRPKTMNVSKNSNKVTKKTQAGNKIENLKKYLRIAGIHIQSYDKLWVSSKSMKAKSEKLMELLRNAGLKGNPTIKNCKKLKKKIEKKKEIEELDLTNIIDSEGRPRRNARSLYLNSDQPSIPKKRKSNVLVDSDENSPPLQRFPGLKGIVDSEESD